MDANLQYWPKIGDRVSYSGAVLGEKEKTSQFLVKEIKEEYPWANLRNIFVSPYPTLFNRYGSVGRKIILF